jgi:hypothetical protein
MLKNEILCCQQRDESGFGMLRCGSVQGQMPWHSCRAAAAAGKFGRRRRAMPVVQQQHPVRLDEQYEVSLFEGY